LRIEYVDRHRDNGVVPFQVADVNYWPSGETLDRINTGGSTWVDLY
jgi:hypothetical protein